MPHGLHIEVKFASAYTPPNHDSINCVFVYDSSQWVALDGLAANGYGIGSVSNVAQGATLAGISSLALGNTSAQLKNRVIYAHGTVHETVLAVQRVSIVQFVTAQSVGDVLRGLAGVSINHSFYRAPTGTLIWADFITPYTPPAHNDVDFDFLYEGAKYLNVYGSTHTTFGTLATGIKYRYLTAFGWRDSQFGSIQSVINKDQTLQPPGALYTGYGQPTIWNKARYLVQINVNPNGLTQWGTAALREVVTQRVYPSGKYSQSFGTQFVSWLIRTVTHQYGHTPSYGTPMVAYKLRSITVPWSSFTQWGTAVFGGTRTLSPAGLSASLYGVANFKLGNVLYPAGISQTAFGTNRFSESPQRAWVSQNAQHTVYGTAKLYNLRQYLTHLYDSFGDMEHEVGTPWVFNRNRRVGVQSWSSMKFPITATVLNTGWGVSQFGNSQTQWGGTLIAARIRHVQPPGVTPTWVSWYSRIHNNARVISVAGMNSGVVGTPGKVESNRRYVKAHSVDQAQYGQLFIAYRVRGVEQILSKDTMRLGELRISLFENFITPVGIDSAKYAAPVLIGPFKRKIAPYTPSQMVFGYPTARNKTPQLFNRGAEQTTFGTPWFSFRVRPLAVQGFGPVTLWGNNAISYRTRTLYVIGQQTLSIPISHRAFREGPDLPSNRLVVPDSIYIAPMMKFGPVKVGGHPQPLGINSALFGTVSIRNQGCVTVWDWPSSQWTFGRPSLNAPQYITFTPTDETSLDRLSTEFGKPRFSPHTIWATLSTPNQALLNHTPSNMFYMVGMEPNDHEFPHWGKGVSITLKNRRISTYHSFLSKAAGGEVGEEGVVSNRIRRVYPEGIKSLKFGYLIMPHTRRLWQVGSNLDRYGEVTVTNVDTTLRISPASVNPPMFAWPLIEFRNRSYQMTGFVNTKWGNNDPMVHYPRRPLINPNLVATQWGQTYIAPRIRTVQVEGWDESESPSLHGDISEVMRVRKINEKVLVGGFDSLCRGLPAVRNKAQRINPFMIPAPVLCGVGNRVSGG